MKTAAIALVAVAALSSCAPGAAQRGESLESLPGVEAAATGTNNLLESNTRDYEEVTGNSVVVNKFISDVEAGYGLVDERSEQIVNYLIRSGFLWCDRLRLGMNVLEVEIYILETFPAPVTANLERASAVAAAINFCPDQLSTFES